jgi:hypothetical protein
MNEFLEFLPAQSTNQPYLLGAAQGEMFLGETDCFCVMCSAPGHISRGSTEHLHRGM